VARSGSPADEQVLTARWVFPVDRLPLRRGCVTVRGERIVSVDEDGQRTADVDLGNAALLPGLVNAHAHLDLSGMRGLAAPTPDFPAWLGRVIAHRRQRTPEQVAADVAAGLAESVRHGTTLLGDVSGDGGSWDVLKDAPVRAVVFRELLGLTPERAAQALSAAADWLEAHPATTSCRPGLSPHAPYSVRADLFARSAPWAEEYGAPVAIHLAESAAEMELLRHRTGPFVGFLQALGVWDPDGLARSPEEVRDAGGVPPRVGRLFVHGNFLPPDFGLSPRDTVVYCPRTHAAFGHPPHPFRTFLGRGVRVALGTDSLASNPDLSILAEARFVHERHPDVPGATLLRMATLSGAEALGWADETGSLTPGKSADLVVVPLPDEETPDPHRSVLQSAAGVGAVMVRGRWLAAGL
jgi:cytosine/adenosine deaminase-related metal-dependent hydrolase